eukprot:scaffold199311_cov47-Prasinocladus_malaysianus.AAC.2
MATNLGWNDFGVVTKQLAETEMDDLLIDNFDFVKVADQTYIAHDAQLHIALLDQPNCTTTTSIQ